MTRKLTAAIAASAIAMTSLSVTPAKALTDEEALLLIAGAAAIMILASNNPPAPAPAPVPVPAPVTYSTGPILLKQTFTADFDTGTVGGAGADLWFQAVNPTKRFLKPRNGAKLALGDGTNRGFAGCSVASYSGQKIKLAHVPVGTYVCMKTNQGRISQFRVNAVYGGAVKKMKLGYTTWQ